jgi:hypothetical protein
MGANYYLPGAHNVICDRTGFKIKSTQARKEWTGRVVRVESWEPRHPQDFLRSFQDDQSVPDPRPRPADRFLADNEVTADDL